MLSSGNFINMKDMNELKVVQGRVPRGVSDVENKLQLQDLGQVGL